MTLNRHTSTGSVWLTVFLLAGACGEAEDANSGNKSTTLGTQPSTTETSNPNGPSSTTNAGGTTPTPNVTPSSTNGTNGNAMPPIATNPANTQAGQPDATGMASANPVPTPTQTSTGAETPSPGTTPNTTPDPDPTLDPSSEPTAPDPEQPDPVDTSDTGMGETELPPAGVEGLDPFSFFVTSLAALQALSGSPDGFGGDLTYGEADGLTGADKICGEIAERSMAGASAKEWRAFLSTATGGPDDGPIHAKDRVGDGPWYDRLGRVVALDLDSLLQARPEGADPEIAEDLPNEDGVPNHAPDGELVDNHDTLTGSNSLGEVYADGGDAMAATCNNWTSKEPSGKPRVGHPWPTGAGGGVGGGFGGAEAGGGFGGGMMGGGGLGGGAFDLANWISALDEAGCAPGVFLEEMGPPMADNPTVGSGGGYGAFYCFALNP